MMTVYRSNQYKIQRRHRSNTTRWLHDPDDIIPTREPDHMGLKDWCKCMVFAVVMTVLMFLVWWFRG